MKIAELAKRAAWAAPLAVFSLLALAAGCGKEEQKPEAKQAEGGGPKYEHRMQDPEYRAELKKLHREQIAVQARAMRVKQAMETFKERAKKALPAGATEEQALAELDAHPDKYPGWQELRRREKKAEGDVGRNQLQIRSAIRARILYGNYGKKNNLAKNGKSGK